MSAKLNRAHYHVWFMASTGSAFFKRTRAFHTKQAAHKYAARRQPDPAKRMVKECWEPKCAPKLD